MATFGDFPGLRPEDRVSGHPALRVAHECRFPIEHRGNGEPILFACTVCHRPAWKEIDRLREENDALREKVAQLEKGR